MATWNSLFLLTPRSYDSPTQGDDEIRTFKAALQERIKNEHTTYDADATGGVAALDWLHKAGSAVGYYLPTASEPAVGLSTSPLKAGALWFDTTTLGLKIWTGAAWISLDPSVTPLLTKVIATGDWNMDTTTGLNIAHGLDSTKIRTIAVFIRNDLSPTVYHELDYGAGQSGYGRWDAVNINLTRYDAGVFDNTNYDAVAYNRGWITIWYVP